MPGGLKLTHASQLVLGTHTRPVRSDIEPLRNGVDRPLGITAQDLQLQPEFAQASNRVLGVRAQLVFEDETGKQGLFIAEQDLRPVMSDRRRIVL